MISTLLYLPFLLQFIISLLYVVLAISSKKWVTVVGSILSITVQRHSRPPKQIGAPMYITTISPIIKYEYTVNGKKYVGSRISFNPINREYEDENTMYESLGMKHGSNVSVYYFKYFPSISVLKPHDTKASLYVILMLFGLAGMFAIRYYCKIFIG